MFFLTLVLGIVSNRDHARPPLPRRAAMAGDNTIGWQDKQAYRAKLTIAKAAVRQVQRQEVKETLQKKDALGTRMRQKNRRESM